MLVLWTSITVLARTGRTASVRKRVHRYCWDDVETEFQVRLTDDNLLNVLRVWRNLSWDILFSSFCISFFCSLCVHCSTVHFDKFIVWYHLIKLLIPCNTLYNICYTQTSTKGLLMYQWDHCLIVFQLCCMESARTIAWRIQFWWHPQCQVKSQVFVSQWMTIEYRHWIQWTQWRYVQTYLHCIRCCCISCDVHNKMLMYLVVSIHVSRVMWRGRYWYALLYQLMFPVWRVAVDTDIFYILTYVSWRYRDRIINSSIYFPFDF